MATFRMICSSSQSQFSVIMLAMVMAGLSLFPVATMAQQNYTYYTSVVNGFSSTLSASATGTIYVRYTFVYDSYRVIEPIGTVLAPGQERAVIVDNYPGVKQIEIDLTRFYDAYDYLERIKSVTWFFAGPNQTAFSFDGVGLWYGPIPEENPLNLVWGGNQESLYIPSFLKSSSSSVNSLEEGDLMM